MTPKWRLLPVQVVSQAPAAGQVLVLPSLADVQGSHYDQPHILIAERVGGMEDILVRCLFCSPSCLLPKHLPKHFL